MSVVVSLCMDIMSFRGGGIFYYDEWVSIHFLLKGGSGGLCWLIIVSGLGVLALVIHT